MREYAVSPLQHQFVGDVMLRSVPTVPSSMRVSDLVGQLTRMDPTLSAVQAWPVIDHKGSWRESSLGVIFLRA